MSPEPSTVDPAEAMLAELAGLDLSLARHVHACATATDDPAEVAELAKAYQRIARSVRQSLALHAQLKRDRERDLRENPPPPAPPPPRDAARIRQRLDDLRAPVQRVIWAEHEHAEDDLAGYYFDLLEERMAIRARDNAFGLVARGEAWAVEPLDDHVLRLCRDLALPEEAAHAWRDLPDPPPEATLPLADDDEDDEDEDDDDEAAPQPALLSSA